MYPSSGQGVLFDSPKVPGACVQGLLEMKATHTALGPYGRSIQELLENKDTHRP